MPKLPIEQVVVDERIREDYGNLDELAESMRVHGLIHPIVVDANNRLIAGGRRLEAAKQLGWTEIEVRYLGELSEYERRMIEIEENVRRKDLTEYEHSKRLVELLEAAKEAALKRVSFIQQAKETCTPRVQVSPQVSMRGPMPTPGSLRDVSAQTGVPVMTFVEAKQHVETIEEIPELVDQPKKAVVEFGRLLRKIDDPAQRETVKQAVSQNPDAVKQLRNLDKESLVKAAQERLQQEYFEKSKVLEDAYAIKRRINRALTDLITIVGEKTPENIDKVIEQYLTCCHDRTDFEHVLDLLDAAYVFLEPFRERIKARLTKPELVQRG